jgi:RimJ/RimL family protein N-acetyltransferase
VPGPGEDDIVAIAQYFLDPKTQTAEVAFIVQDDWQQKGMGSLLMNYLTSIAIQRGIKRFDAKVMPQNKAMLAVFQHSGLSTSMEFNGEAYTIVMDLRKNHPLPE